MVEQQKAVSDDTSRLSGKDAQRTNILAATLLADVVKTTLGPKGMDKMLVDPAGNITVTNDGATILRELDIDHPAAKMIVNIAQTQEQEVGDGTTTAALLAGSLLKEASLLLDKKIHPTIIIKGYQSAMNKALESLQNSSRPVDSTKILRQIVLTAMTGKGAEIQKEILSDLLLKAVEIVSHDNKFDKSSISVQKRSGLSVSDSCLIQGIILEKGKAHPGMPSFVSNSKILLLDCSLELRNPEGESQLNISSPEQLELFVASEEHRLKNMVNKVINSGAKVVFCQRGIDDTAQYYLAEAGILTVRRVNRSDVEKISKATSATIVSNLSDIDEKYLGFASSVKEELQGEECYLYIEGCANPKTVTILVRGGSQHNMDEVARALDDGIGDLNAVLNSRHVVAGGGAIEIELSKQLNSYAKSLNGKEQLAVEAFARALEIVPETLAENAGLDPLLVLTELKKAHDSGRRNEGLNLLSDKIEDTFQAGIIEPVSVKRQAISSASEMANLLLRIDDNLISKGKQADRSLYEGMD